jgi:hypothetical protein
VVDETAHVSATLDVRAFNVYDSLFGLDREHASALGR